MSIFAAERAVGGMEVPCWDMRDGGVGGEGQGLLVRVAAFWCPCPHCSLGCPRKVRYSAGSSCALRGVLLGDDIFPSHGWAWGSRWGLRWGP